MTNSQAQVFNAVRRVQNFLDANDAVFSVVNKSATRAELNDVSSTLSANQGTQAASKVNAKGETSNQRALRLALRVGHMVPIAAIAKMKLRSIPQFSALRLPSSNASAHAVAAAAVEMSSVAKQYEQVFIDAGLAPDFIAKLDASAAAVRGSIESRSTNTGQKTGATGALKTAAPHARKVLQALNSMVVSVLNGTSGEASLLTEWKSIHRVTLKSGPAAGTIQAARSAASASDKPAAAETAVATPVLADAVVAPVTAPAAPAASSVDRTISPEAPASA